MSGRKTRYLLVAAAGLLAVLMAANTACAAYFLGDGFPMSAGFWGGAPGSVSPSDSSDVLQAVAQSFLKSALDSAALGEGLSGLASPPLAPANGGNGHDGQDGDDLPAIVQLVGLLSAPAASSPSPVSSAGSTTASNAALAEPALHSPDAALQTRLPREGTTTAPIGPPFELLRPPCLSCSHF